MPIASINPATTEVVRTFVPLTRAELDDKLNKAMAAYKRPFADRKAAMLRAADIFEQEKDALGRMMVLEMGKTLKSAIAEIEKCAACCTHYAESAEAYLKDEPVAARPGATLKFLPIGPVLAVMPWNFPFWQVVRFAAPALMAGNVGLLKHASNVPQCALAIESVFLRAGFPEGSFQTLIVGSAEVGPLIADKRIAAVTLTGSEGAGAAVAEAAGKHLKKTVLELGGSDPFIVMPSADVEKAASVAVDARIICNGQSCIAAKRFIVHTDIYDAFEERFVRKMSTLKVGDPLAPETDVGPLASADGLDTLTKQVNGLVKAGARVLTGGKPVGGRGHFFQPTVLTSVPEKFHEELFGPVACLYRVASIDEAIALANDSPFGLGSSAWTNDAAEVARFAAEIEAGQTFVNQMVVSDPRVPFGGVKTSGYGRELGALGIREFCNIKTIVT